MALNPTLSQSFTFVDGNGNTIVADTKNFLDISPLNYTYDRFEPVPGFPTPSPTPAASVPVSVAAMAPQALSLAPDSGEGRLDPELSHAAQPMALTAHLRSNLPGKRTIWYYDKSRPTPNPVCFTASISISPRTPGRQQRADHYVGTINFFAFVPHGHGGPPAHGAPAHARERFVSFDITSRIRALNFSRALKEKPNITVIPAGKPAANANPTIGKVELVIQ